ncbi:MAG TPA: hypothetical protein VF593_14315 [Chthoniobacteraceae bacterium]|jgi:hypothetical protein
MKLPTILLLCLTFGLNLHAQTTSDIVAIDVTAATLSASTGGDAAKVYRLRPSVEVKINGARSRLTDLSVGMSARITAGEPGFATRIEATGIKSGTATGGIKDKAALQQKLTGTTWQWHESTATVETLTFKAEGIARLSSRPRPFQWEAASDGNRVEGVTQMGKKFRMTFDDAFTQGKIYEADGTSRPTRLVTK